MKYFLIAGEKSGDLHASNLMKSLIISDKKALFKFIGGDNMASIAGSPIVHYKDMAIMGLWEVLRNLNKINSILEKCKKHILNFNPDVVILIDFAGFNLRIARFVKKHRIPVIYYISPKVWAWNTSRAWKIKRDVDKMLVILPFEKEFYRRFDWAVEYVGNPVVDAVSNFRNDEKKVIRPEHTQKTRIAVLPGSRNQEVSRMLPILVEVIKMYQEHHFLIAKVNSVKESLYEPCKHLTNVSLIEESAYDILSVAQAAIVTSGTATLETALFKVPQVVCYKTDWFSYMIGSRLVKVDYISLVNLIANEKIVEELLQENCTSERISIELDRILSVEGDKKMMEGYEKVINILGNESASNKAANAIYQYLT
jgi:lipid-A-disaccharide synthase